MSAIRADESAFDTFVASRLRSLSRAAHLLTGDHHLAEDLVQTTLFKAAKAWHRIQGDPEPYVRRILHNEGVSMWRRRKLQEVPLEYGAHRPGPAEDSDLRISLRDALTTLTPRQRSVIVLRYYDDLTEVQTAAVLDIAPGTVKSMTREAFAKLRQNAPHLADLITAGGDA
ncbi:MAG TPA: SigE family RNA polymerase sigma factor [Nocardioidaceae bacterium]|nr:SigE family RNA polymerase sigma factor [Nocardioidaceae bacterium]